MSNDENNAYTHVKNARTHIPPYVSRAREVYPSHTGRRLAPIADHAETSEKAIEPYLAKRARENGWLCLKYSNPGMAGYPDRIIVMPQGRTAWVEVKSKGRKPDKRQLMRHQELAGLGHVVRVVDSRSAVDELINELAR